MKLSVPRWCGHTTGAGRTCKGRSDMIDATPERWQPVVGWEGLYEVSDRGQVRSLRRRTASGMRGGKLLTQYPDSQGYLQVGLCRDGTCITKKVHRLVAEAFLGPAPAGMETRHGPAGNQRNSVTNLSYGTRVENHADKVRDGTKLLGSEVPSSKLNERVVRECRMRWAAGASAATLAAEFRVHVRVMYKALQGETWGHVG